MDERLPAHLEVAGLIRAVQAAGGFATVLQRGEKDAGSLLLVTISRSEPARLWERMPRLDGHRRFSVSRTQDPEKPRDFEEFWLRRGAGDPDAWILELDVPEPERFIASPVP